MTRTGFQLGRGIKKLLPAYDEIKSRSYQWMVWAQANYSYSPSNGPFSAFIFEPRDPEDASQGFRLYVNRGHESPVLIANKVNPFWFTKVICSNVRKHGIANPDQSTWFFDTPGTKH